MSPRTNISARNGDRYFYFEQLARGVLVRQFDCQVDEYNVYLAEDALRSQDDHIALTWLLRGTADRGIAAYMSLIADAIKLTVTEKDLHALNYPFKTIPAMKIAKLAVSASYQGKYKGIGSFMITSAITVARKCNETLFACRFLTVDADVEHNESVLSFYKKNGFLINSETNNKNRKNISMRKDIYF
jgi:ribosomal protein S18 acetylase RimI-like enzyme